MALAPEAQLAWGQLRRLEPSLDKVVNMLVIGTDYTFTMLREQQLIAWIFNGLRNSHSRTCTSLLCLSAIDLSLHGEIYVGGDADVSFLRGRTKYCGNFTCFRLSLIHVRKIFGLRWKEVTGAWRKLCSEELHDLYCCQCKAWWGGWGMLSP
jgi:hypothetical protein